MVDPTFESRLESQVIAEVRRRNLAAKGPRWSTWSGRQLMAAACVLVVVSAGLGGAVVATAYETQQGQQRDQIIANIEQRKAIAQQRVDVALKDREYEQRKFEVGMSHANAVLEKDMELAQARVALVRLDIDLAEVRAGGQEPRSDLSAPRIGGHDFVSERLQHEMAVPVMQMAAIQKMARDIQTRVEIGTMAPTDLEVANNRLAEAESLRQYVLRRQEIRRQFLDGRLDAAETELRALEAEAEHKQRSIKPRIEVAKAEVVRLTQRVGAGTATLVDVAEAKLRQGDLETTLLKADLDLLLIRQRIKQYRR